MSTSITFTIGKLNESRTVRVPDSVRNQLLQYGVQQWVNDRHAMVTEKAFPNKTDRETETRSRVNAACEAIENGTMTVRGPAMTTESAIAFLKAQGMTIAQIEAVLNKTPKKAA